MIFAIRQWLLHEIEVEIFNENENEKNIIVAVFFAYVGDGTSEFGFADV